MGKIILLLIIILMSCNYIEDVNILPELKGAYANYGIILNFDNNKITGNTKCNSISGGYTTFNNNIFISVGSTKVFCENEFDINVLKSVERFLIIDNELILIGTDFEIVFNNL